MEQTCLQRFLSHLDRTYYMHIPVIFASIFLLYVILKNFQGKRFSFLFLTYSLSCILLFVGASIKTVFFSVTDEANTIITETANTIFAIVELIVFAFFFLEIIQSKTVKKILLFLSAGFFLTTIVFFYTILDANSTRSEILKASITTNILEFSIFLIAVLCYFIELFTKPPTQDIAQSPAFWISSGVFIYILVSLPMLLFADYIQIQDKKSLVLLFAFHYVSLALLLVTIVKAFLCQKPITA